MNAATFVRSWPSVSAWGAGLIVASLGAGAIVGPGSGVASRGLGAGLVVLGVASLVWGGAVLALGRLVAPRAALAGVLIALVATSALMFVLPAHTSVLAVAAAMLLLVVVGGAAAVHLRRRGRSADSPRTAQPMSVVGLLVAASVIAVVVTPALGAAQNAVLLRDDGSVPVISHEGH
ncbi:hypothetical protein [Microbacterium sp. Bi128]|uniref:hypothetical protein n=1 Tax=Microbacterium sp. Bi128 TaxID=2821115 RepID=UPI001DD711C1|nr:hypothetical protein [Microbacterium sp. Bi128]CAH0238403.1 hypothetical protein SRABI128_02617 [Microbacterium sp. Bi128]